MTIMGLDLVDVDPVIQSSFFWINLGNPDLWGLFQFKRRRQNRTETETKTKMNSNSRDKAKLS